MLRGDQTEFDITYLTVNAIDLLGTLYVPEGEGPFPAAVSVHGGTWVGGDRFSNQATNRMLAEQGIAVLAVDFRTPPPAAIPTASPTSTPPSAGSKTTINSPAHGRSQLGGSGSPAADTS